MKIAIVLCTLFALALAARPVPVNIRERARDIHQTKYHGDYERRATDRIIGGHPDVKYAHPYQISLQRLPSSGSWFHTCGGSIIGESKILTAAHCVDDTTVTASAYRVIAGEYELYRDEGVEKTLAVDRIVIHEKWDEARINNDVAVLHLKGKINYDSYAKKVELATVKPSNGTASTVTGWGWTDYSQQTRPTILQALSTQTFTSGKVLTSGWLWGSAEETTIDPGYYTTLWDPVTQVAMYNSDKGVCKGDSGGPLIRNDNRQQYGIVSYGQLPCGQNRPDYFANVAHFKNWIETH